MFSSLGLIICDIFLPWSDHSWPIRTFIAADVSNILLILFSKQLIFGEEVWIYVHENQRYSNQEV